MKTNILYMGNIKKITSFKLTSPIYMGNNIVIKKSKIETEYYKKAATLVKVSNNTYVDIDNINSILELLILKVHLKFDLFLPNEIVSLLLSTNYYQLEGTLYIESLNNHPETKNRDTISFNKLKKLCKNKK